MTGLRSKQKRERRDVMLAAASKLFERQGYARTTFDEIAAAANMGVATVYKYFGSKEGVVKALLEPGFTRIVEQGERVIAHPPTDPARAVILLLGRYGELGGHQWARRDLLRMAIYPGLGNEGVLASYIAYTDARVRVQIRELLVRLRRLGRIAPQLDLKDASSVIFSVFNQHFAEYVTRDDLPFAAMFTTLQRHIRLLFSAWTPERKPVSKGQSVKRTKSLIGACVARQRRPVGHAS